MAVAPTPVHKRGAFHGRDVARAAVVVVVLAVIAILALIVHDIFSGSSGSSGIQGSGIPAAQTRELPPFESVELSGTNNVDVRVGETQSVVVHADNNLIDRVTTEVSADNLVIGNKDGSVTTKTPMRVDITVPSIHELTLSGSGTIVAAGIDTKDMTVTLSGSGVVNASGGTDRLEVTVGGSGDAQLGMLEARDVRAVVSGSGRILVNAAESIDASVPGSGSIVYTGDPEHVKTMVTGSGAVTRG